MTIQYRRKFSANVPFSSVDNTQQRIQSHKEKRKRDTSFRKDTGELTEGEVSTSQGWRRNGSDVG